MYLTLFDFYLYCNVIINAEFLYGLLLKNVFAERLVMRIDKQMTAKHPDLTQFDFL